MNIVNKKNWSIINGLTGIFVIPLIFYSFNNKLLPGGYLCIDVLFVVAGYAMTLCIEKNASKNLFEFIYNFYLNGIKKYIPSLAFFTIVFGILISFFSQRNETSLVSGITSLLGLSNIYFWRNGINYFEDNIRLNPFASTWALSVLAQFFFIYPIYLWFCGLKQNKKKYFKNLFISTFYLVILSLFYFLYFFKTKENFTFYLLPTRFWEIGFGCLAYSAIKGKFDLIKNLGKISPFFPFIIIIYLLFTIRVFSLPGVISTVFLSILLLISIKDRTLFYSTITYKRIIYLGKIALPIYLWSWGIFSIGRWTIGIHWWSIPLKISLAFFLAHFCFKKIEPYFDKNLVALSNNLRIIFVSIFLSIPSILLLILSRPLKNITYLGNYKYENLITRSRNSIDLNDKDLVGKNYNGKNCHLLGRTIYSKEIDFGKCKIIRDGEKTIFFLGASHTDHLRETHFRISENRNVSIDSTTVSGCNFPPNPSQKTCGDIQIKQKERIIKFLKKGDLVVISNGYSLNNTWLNEEAVKRLEDFAKDITLIGGKVILFAPTPKFDLSIELCKSEWFRPFPNKDCSVTEKALKSKRNKTYELLGKLSDKILVYDIMDELCPNGVCRMMDKFEKPLYTDTDHFTDYANIEYIYPDFLDFLIDRNLI